MKTVRFTRVVERSGRPRVHTLWVAPDRDPELVRARESNRVMTVEQGRGQTDSGMIGLDPKRDETSQILIFPKSLKPFEGSRVIGIKFDLIDQPKLVPATPAKTRRAPPPKRSAPKKTAAAKAEPPKEESAAPPPSVPKQEERLHESPAARRVPQRQRPPSKAAADAPKKPSAAPNESHLVREILAALEELEAGKNVAAYRRLQRALDRR